MNQIECLKRLIEARLPGVSAELDRPLRSAAPWMLDLSFQSHPVNVEWRRNRGFGLTSDPRHGLGEGPDEILTDLDAAAERAVELLSSRSTTEAPRQASLADLRKRRRLSQKEFARRLKVSQAAISDLERNLSRSKVSTLKRALHALGAELELRAVLPRQSAIRIRL